LFFIYGNSTVIFFGVVLFKWNLIRDLWSSYTWESFLLSFSSFIISFWWYWGLNSGLCTY
jgi:hypothetical protein